VPTLFVTGANRGIGLALTRRYVENGWTAIATCRNPEEAQDLQDLASSAPERVEVYPLSVTDWGGIRNLAERLSGRPIDMLVNNAGVRRMNAYHLGDIDVDGFMRSVEVNALGALKVSEAFRPHLARSKNALLVMMSSSLGSIAKNRQGGDYSYRASKAAMNAVMRSLAVDLNGDGTTVVSVHPGWVRTDMGGRQASLSPEESAAAIQRVLEGVTPDNTGSFLRYDGREDPF